MSNSLNNLSEALTILDIICFIINFNVSFLGKFIFSFSEDPLAEILTFQDARRVYWVNLFADINPPMKNPAQWVGRMVLGPLG